MKKVTTRTSRILAIVLVLAMVLSISALAAWDQYQGNSDHNGVITDAAPLTTSLGTLTTSNYSTPALTYTGGGWSGVDTSPVMEVYGGSTNSQTVLLRGDGGSIYVRPVGDTFGTAAGTTINLSSYVTSPGNVRSTPMYNNGFLFFTSQGGYLWKYNISTGAIIYAYIGGASTSTPVLSNNGYIYVGCYGSTVKGVKAIALTDFTGNITSATDAKWKSIYTIENVQSSVIVYTKTALGSTTDYVYFTTNVSGGAGQKCVRQVKMLAKGSQKG